MYIVRLIYSLVAAALNEFLRQGGRSENEEREQLPPIRYDGDPTEIYLA